MTFPTSHQQALIKAKKDKVAKHRRSHVCADCGETKEHTSFYDPTHQRTHTVRQIANSLYRGMDRLDEEIAARVFLCRSHSSKRTQAWLKAQREPSTNRPDVSAQPERTSAREQSEKGRRVARARTMRRALRSVKDHATCVNCGQSLGHREMYIVREPSLWVDSYTLSTSEAISNDVSIEHVFAALIGSIILCEDCHANRMSVEHRNQGA